MARLGVEDVDEDAYVCEDFGFSGGEVLFCEGVLSVKNRISLEVVVIRKKD